MKKHNLAFIDVETTGLDPLRHEIIEIGGLIVAPVPRPDRGAGIKKIAEFEFKIKPERIAEADPESLRINGYNEAEWLFAPSLNQVMSEVGKRAAGTIMVGHNVMFDWQFVNESFRQAGLKNPLHYHRLDTIAIAYAKLYDDPRVQYFSLPSLCEALGIKNVKAHTALADARATFELYKKLLNIEEVE